MLADVARDWRLWALLILAALTFVLAFRAPYSFGLDVGGSPRDCYAAAVFDAPYLSGFNDAPEFDLPAEQCADWQVAYRWSYGDAELRLPGIGAGTFDLRLRLARGQPSGDYISSGLHIDQGVELALPVAPGPRIYHLLAPSPADGDLALQFRTPTFQPAGDPRALGFALDAVAVESLGSLIPPWQQVLILSASVALVYVLGRRWGMLRPWALATALLMMAGLATLMIWQRQGLTSFSSGVLLLLLLAIGLSVVLDPLAAALARRLRIGCAPWESRSVAALVVLAWLVRTLGVFHPQAYSSDVGLNVNNLLDVTTGTVIFTEGLPAEAGGGQAPYPPAQYVMLAPLHLLPIDPETTLVAVNALADSMTILWLFLAMRLLGASPVAALAAGALYVIATPLLRSLLVGELANVWAQALVPPWLLAFAAWRQGRLPIVVLTAVSLLVLLAHSGVFLSFGLFTGCLAAIGLVRRERWAPRFIGMMAVAVLLAVGLYYTAFLGEIGGGRAETPVASAATRLWLQLGELWRLDGQIGPLVALLGLSGLVYAVRRCPRLWDILLAWSLSAVLSWATLLISGQALRWAAFVFAALAIGGGLVLGALWQRDRSGKAATIVLVTGSAALGLYQWVDRLLIYR